MLKKRAHSMCFLIKCDLETAICEVLLACSLGNEKRKWSKYFEQVGELYTEETFRQGERWRALGSRPEAKGIFTKKFLL